MFCFREIILETSKLKKSTCIVLCSDEQIINEKESNARPPLGE